MGSRGALGGVLEIEPLFGVQGGTPGAHKFFFLIFNLQEGRPSDRNDNFLLELHKAPIISFR